MVLHSLLSQKEELEEQEEQEERRSVVATRWIRQSTVVMLPVHVKLDLILFPVLHG